MNKFLLLLLVIGISACKSKVSKTRPSVEPITESIYASGLVKSTNQYQCFATINGIVEKIVVKEGDLVTVGSPIMYVVNTQQKLNKENAELTANFNSLAANQSKLNEAKWFIELAMNKMKSDSAMWIRQKALWETQIGSKVELENRELVFQNSKVAYLSAKVKYDELKRQIDFTASQAQKNLLISAKSENDFIIRSQVNGKIYSITKSIGELVTPQTPVAVVGNDGNFVLEMQVDEVDIFMVKLDQAVKVSLESYKGSVFDAKVSKIIPYMNERSKTFLVEATFVHPPVSLFPNSTFEANILIQTKKSALLIPRNYLLNDSFVINSSGTKMKVVTGLKDYQKVEILSGLGKDDELLKPTE